MGYENDRFVSKDELRRRIAELERMLSDEQQSGCDYADRCTQLEAEVERLRFIVEFLCRQGNNGVLAEDAEELWAERQPGGES